VAPRVTASSAHEGDVLKTGALTYKVTFSEAINTSTFSASGFDLHGVYRNADYAAALARMGMHVTGRDEQGDARVV